MPPKLELRYFHEPIDQMLQLEEPFPQGISRLRGFPAQALTNWTTRQVQRHWQLRVEILTFQVQEQAPALTQYRQI